MKKILCRLIAVTLSLISLVAGADDITEFTNYVQACKDGLGIDSIPQFGCDDIVFRGSSPAPPGTFAASNDYVAYRKVNDNVDALFACRWILHSDVPVIQGNGTAASAEMLVHNRTTGKTCFFQLPNVNAGTTKDPHVNTINPPSPTDRLGFLFWDTPTNTAKTQCTRCHSAGPYIASSPIAAALAQFGLINNGHDITGTDPANYYSAVGSLGDGSLAYNFNTIAATNRHPPGGCSGSCHLLGGITPDGAREKSITNNGGLIVIPSINIAIDELTGVDNPNHFATLEHMPPFDDISNFHWVNLDTPTNSTPSTGVETENFADAMNAGAKSIVPVLFHGYDANNPSVPSNPKCAATPGYDVPSGLEAHAVGVPANFSFSTTGMAQFDRLRTFNLKEGLVCINSDQEPGQQCSDYAVRYMCNMFGAIITWSDWYNMDSPGNDGDHEERSKDQNICGGVAPIAIQARRFTSGGGMPVDQMGPNDRLARFSPYGLTCNATDQVDAKCSNYVVRYDGCVAAPTAINHTLTNVFVVGKQVTAASNYTTKGQAHNNSWDTQTWVFEPVPNTEYVRLRNTSNNNTVYLNVQSTAEQATVNTATFSNYANQMWTVEPISGSTNVRLKNLFSGLYLTMADPKNFPNSPDYLPIYSQGLNTGWSSQRWIIQ